MKRIWISVFLVTTLSGWGVAQRPQTTAGAYRPSTTVEVVRPQTNVVVAQPVTTVEVVRPQTTVEVLRPQTLDFTPDDKGSTAPGRTAGIGSSSAKSSTSMSNFTPKQAKDFAAAQKAAKLGGGENKLGNNTNTAEKDAANKASSLKKQDNQNMDIDPKAKLSNLASFGASVDKKVEEKSKKK